MAEARTSPSTALKYPTESFNQHKGGPEADSEEPQGPTLLENLIPKTYLIIDSLEPDGSNGSFLSEKRRQAARDAARTVIPYYQKPLHWLLSVYSPVMRRLESFDSLDDDITAGYPDLVRRMVVAAKTQMIGSDGKDFLDSCVLPIMNGLVGVIREAYGQREEKYQAILQEGKKAEKEIKQS
ncbi:MAG: hypothetical protein Q9218_007782 [Villophora microphyllina]